MALHRDASRLVRGRARALPAAAVGSHSICCEPTRAQPVPGNSNPAATSGISRGSAPVTRSTPQSPRPGTVAGFHNRVQTNAAARCPLHGAGSRGRARDSPSIPDRTAGRAPRLSIYPPAQCPSSFDSYTTAASGTSLPWLNRPSEFDSARSLSTRKEPAGDERHTQSARRPDENSRVASFLYGLRLPPGSPVVGRLERCAGALEAAGRAAREHAERVLRAAAASDRSDASHQPGRAR